jgi:hypothetical protein
MMPPDLRATSLAMRALVLVASLAGLLGLVLLISAAYAADPAKPYLGMSKDEIVACAGEPYAKYKSGAEAETLTYHYSGAGPVPGPPGEKKKKDKPSFFPGADKKDKKKGDKGWTCTASLTFENGRLARVAFAHKDVRSPYDWQKEKDPKKQEALRNAPLPTCTFSLPNCAR